MNRQEAITQLAELSVVAQSNQVIGVFLPSFEDVNQFYSELVTKLDEVPKWLLGLRVRNCRLIETNRGTRIRFLHSVRQGRGETFDMFYLSSKLTEKQKSQYVFDLLPAMVHSKPIITFEDD